MKRQNAITIFLVWTLLLLLIRCDLVERSDSGEYQLRTVHPKTVPAKTGGKIIGSRLKRDEVQTLIRLHNKARADVGVGPFNWSAKLASYAQKWADHLAATGCRMEHRPSTGIWRRI